MDRNNDLIIDVAAKAAKPQARPKAEDEAQEEESQGSGFDSLLAGTKNKQKFPMDFILDGETTVTVNIKS